MGLQERSIPTPAEPTLLAVGAAAQQQQLEAVLAFLQQAGHWNAQGAVLRLQQPQASVVLHAFKDGDALVVFENRRGGDALQLRNRDIGQRHREIHAAEQLAHVVERQPLMAFEHPLDLFADAVPLEGNAVMLGQSFTQGHGDVPWSAGPRHRQHLGVGQGQPGTALAGFAPLNDRVDFGADRHHLVIRWIG